LTIWLLQEWHLVLNKGCTRKRLPFSAEDKLGVHKLFSKAFSGERKWVPESSALPKESMAPQGNLVFWAGRTASVFLCSQDFKKRYSLCLRGGCRVRLARPVHAGGTSEAAVTARRSSGKA
jgi:hypothetical protein